MMLLGSEVNLSVLSRAKAIAVAGVILLVAILGLGGIKSCTARQAGAYALQVAVAQGRESAAKAELAKAQESLESARVEREAQNVVVDNLQAALDAARKPSPRPDPPVTEKAAELRSKGILTPLPENEVAAIWSWSRDAVDLPLVTERLAAAEALIAGQKAQVHALNLENAAAREVIQRQVQLLADRAEQIRGLNGQLAAAVRAEKVGKLEKTLELAGALALGAIAGRASK